MVVVIVVVVMVVVVVAVVVEISHVREIITIKKCYVFCHN